MTWKEGRQVPDNTLMRFVARVFPHGANMLDIGCGEGANARELRERGHWVFTIDKDPETEPDHVADVCEFEHMEGCFELVYDVNTLCHVQNPPLEKIRTWLQPNGFFFTIWPSYDTWPGVADGKDYTRLVHGKELAEIVRSAGFNDVHLWCIRTPRFEEFTIHRYFDSWLVVARV